MLAAAGGSGYALRHVSSQKRESAQGEVGSLAAALPRLEETGYAVVTDCVPQTALQRCTVTDAYCSMPKTAAVGQSKLWRLSAFGRYHRVQFTASDLAAFEELEELFAPLVEAFFREECGDGAAGRRVYRSELQLLTAAPTVSQQQSWHSDNRSRGITIVVPLVDFTAENGATQLLPGSHELGKSWRALLRDGARVVTPCAGSIALCASPAPLWPQPAIAS